jgi:3-oxoacyl-[acyl-carrier-protein] synthase II
MADDDRNSADSLLGDDVAIIGMACRFPGADNKAAYWKNLVDGLETITFIDKDRIKSERHLISNPRYVPAGGLLDQYDCFDAALFGIPDHIAELMTPEHRAFLECAWDVMIDGGYNSFACNAQVGVYGACNPQSIAMYGPSPNWISASDSVLEHSQAWLPDALTAYTLYYLGLTGESLTLNALCSGFHAAVHLACHSLLLGQVDMAIAGGVMIRLPHERGYLWEPGKTLSHDGHSRPFDAEGTGGAPASGVATFLLKRAAAAIKDRDNIYALIKGTAINNNGAKSAGFGILQPERLAACIATGLAAAAVPSETVTMVEAVGAALPIFDAIEVNATAQAFKTSKRRYCSLGSVKGNLGHAGVASGGASAIKSALSIVNRVIPKSVNFKNASPELDLAHSPFVVQQETAGWMPDCGVRRASVNSIGGAGYNAHMLLEEAPSRPRRSRATGDRREQLIVLSGRTKDALEAQMRNLNAQLRAQPQQSIGDIAYTLLVGRRAEKYRWAAVSNTTAELASKLDAPGAADVFPGTEGVQRNVDEELLEETDGGLALKKDGKSRHSALRALAKAWASGSEVNCDDLYKDERPSRVSLPSYPFERRRYWRTSWN